MSTLKQGQFAIKELSEGDPVFGGVQVHVVSVGKVHGHIQGILCVPLEAKVTVPHKRQDAAAVSINILPNPAPPAQVSCVAGFVCWLDISGCRV